MTSPVRQQTPSAFTPMAEALPEPKREPSPETRDALLKDRAEMQREVILWQRWIRYLALLVLTVGAVMVSGQPRNLDLWPVVAVGAGYVLCVFAAGVAVQRMPALT